MKNDITANINATPAGGMETAVSRRSIYVFIAVNFLWWAGLYLYVPVLPIYIEDSGASLSLVGIVLAAYALPQMLFRMPLGIWSDKLGKRKGLVAAGIVFSSLGALGLGLVNTPGPLFLFRMITGIGAAAWVVFPLYFTAYYPAKDSGKALGLLNFVRNLALIAATVGSGYIAGGLGTNIPFIGAAILGIFALSGLLLTKELPVPRKITPTVKSAFPAATRPLLLAVSVMALLLQFAVFSGVFGFVPIYASQIGASIGQVGLITMINLGFSALGSLGGVWLWQKTGYRTTIFWSALIISISSFVIPFTNAVPALMAVQAVSGLGGGVLSTLFMALSIHGLPREQQATAMGVYQAIYAIGILAGPLTSGFLANNVSLSSVFYLASGMVLAVALLAFLPVFPKREKV